MGHERKYVSFGIDKTQAYITDYVMDDIAHSGDRYGSQDVLFLTGRCDNYDEAYDLLEKKAQGKFYPSYAVQYLARSNAKTVAVQVAQDKLNKLSNDRSVYMDTHSVHKRKSAFIGCPHCNSKLANDRFKGEYCPVCRGDLRPATVQERVKAYDVKIKKAHEDVLAAYHKNEVKAVEWLVMYEYHV